MENKYLKRQLNRWNVVASSGNDPIKRGGWNNSYSGEPFSKEEMEEYSDNVLIKLKPYIMGDSTVLEIGCASGITMYKIAPLVGRYIGTDMTPGQIDYNKSVIEENDINNIELIECSADMITKEYICERPGIVIINSVIQYFENEGYLCNVMNNIYEILDDNGILFIGDVRDLELKADFENSVIEYRKENGLPIKKFPEELFLHKDYFRKLAQDTGFIRCEITDKIGKIDNELLQYRYDVMLFKQ